MFVRLRMTTAFRPLCDETPATISMAMVDVLSDPRPPSHQYSSCAALCMSRWRSMNDLPRSRPKSNTLGDPSRSAASSGSTSSSLDPLASIAFVASLSIAPLRADSMAILAGSALSSAMRSMTAVRDATAFFAAASLSSVSLPKTSLVFSSSLARLSTLESCHFSELGYASR